jgi:hypothetical protein
VAKIRFTFGRDMSDEEMWQAFKKMAKECGIETRDTYKPKKKKVKKSRQVR